MSNKNRRELEKFNTPPGFKESEKMDRKIALHANKFLNPVPKKEETLFNLVFFSSIFFPYVHTDPDIPKVVKQGNLSMVMESNSIIDIEGKAVRLGLPYGTRPRLLSYLISSTAIKTKSKKFKLAENYHDLIKKLGLKDRSSRTLNSVIEQLIRFANTAIGTTFSGSQGVFITKKFLIEQIYMPKIKYLEQYDKKVYQGEVENGNIKGIWIALNQDYFDLLMKYRLPIDRRSVMLLNDNALALDILNWLSYRLYKVEDPNGDFISWQSLYYQFGLQYKNTRDFKKKFIEGMSYVMSYGFTHEMDNVKHNKNGIFLFPIDKKERTIEIKNQLKLNL